MSYVDPKNAIDNIAKLKALEKLSKMTRDEIDVKIKKYKKEVIIKHSIVCFLCIAVCIAFVFMIINLEGFELNIGIPIGLPIFILSIYQFFNFLVDLFYKMRKDDKVLIVEILKTEMIPDVQNSQSIEKFVDSSFITSKTIDITTNDWSSAKLFIDNVHKKFMYKKNEHSFTDAYNFSDILNYEVYEDGASVVQGRAGSALIGGAFFGVTGAIIGSSRKRNISPTCTSLKLIIRLNNLTTPQIEITFINTPVDKSTLMYSKARNNLQLICSTLEYMINNKTLEQSSTISSQPVKIEEEPKQVSVSNKEQLKELKEMLDDGLITQEDFEQKKKQILGL